MPEPVAAYSGSYFSPFHLQNDNWLSLPDDKLATLMVLAVVLHEKHF